MILYYFLCPYLLVHISFYICFYLLVHFNKSKKDNNFFPNMTFFNSRKILVVLMFFGTRKYIYYTCGVALSFKLRIKLYLTYNNNWYINMCVTSKLSAFQIETDSSNIIALSCSS